MNGTDVHKIVQQKGAKCIVFGSESHGISPEIESLLTERITIPKIGAGESLNVGVAAGIVLDLLTK